MFGTTPAIVEVCLDDVGSTRHRGPRGDPRADRRARELKDENRSLADDQVVSAPHRCEHFPAPCTHGPDVDRGGARPPHALADQWLSQSDDALSGCALLPVHPSTETEARSGSNASVDFFMARCECNRRSERALSAFSECCERGATG